MADNLTGVKAENMCRTCLNNDGNFSPLFEDLKNSVTLGDMISAVTGLRICYGDNLPAVICDDCKATVKNAYDFKNKSIKSELILKGLLNVTKSSLENCLTEVQVSNDIGVDVKSSPAVAKLTNDDFDTDMDTACLPDLQEMFCEEPDKKGQKATNFLSCHICSKKFKNKKTFSAHTKICVKEEILELDCYCPMCGVSSNDPDVLNKHMWSVHAQLMESKTTTTNTLEDCTRVKKTYEKRGRPKNQDVLTYKCTFCSEDLSTKQELVHHLEIHKDVSVLCCNHCSKMYLEREQILQHNCSDVPADTEDKQVTEYARFVTVISVKELIDSTSDMGPLDFLHCCSLCSIVLHSNNQLLDHIDVEHPEKSLRCKYCFKSFSSTKAANRHREMCAKIERNFICNICSAGFQYEISLNKHILRQHQGESVSVNFMNPEQKIKVKQHHCTICSESFHTPEMLEKHSKNHLPNENIYECNVCNKQFNRKDNLKSHLRVHLPKTERVKPSVGLCLYCGRSFTSSSNLIVHMRRHTGEKPYKCDFCGKGFPRSSDLQCHRRSHTGEKPCVCKVCGKAFSRSNKLTRHMRVHTGVKPYKCTYCDKAFAQSNDLTLHIRRHTNDKPYVCEVCGDRFIQGTALQNHRRAHGHFSPSSSNTTPRQKAPLLLKEFSADENQNT